MARRGTLYGMDSKILKGSTMDFCMEILRSVSLFMIITKIMFFTAMLLLILLTDDTVQGILMSDDTTIKYMENLYDAFKLIICIILLQSIVITFIGMYGLARLNRYCLSFYGMTIILICIWHIYFLVIIYSRSNIDLVKAKLYSDFKKSDNAKRAVNILQKTFKCCGSEVYKFEDLEILPISCCPNVTSENECTSKYSYKVLCPINQTNVVTNLEEMEMSQYNAVISSCVVFLSIFEASIVFYIIHRLNMMYTTNVLQF